MIHSPPAFPGWAIDQQNFTHGLSPQALARAPHYQTQASTLWQATEQLAAQQPIVSAVDAVSMAEMMQQVARLQQVAEHLVVIGTGGASLGAHALCSVVGSTQVHFVDNGDAATLHNLFATRDPLRTAWVAISKSGETIETLAVSLALIAQYDLTGMAARLAERTLAITSSHASPLRTLAQQQGWPILAHPDHLGGRFSVFSAPGLVPAAFAGIAIEPLLAQATLRWQQLLATRDTILFDAASCFAASLPEQPLHVVMGYADRLRPYTQWYKQLWAESLGKHGAGPTPITAIGSLDQHSQLQLYLDGPRDKLFTLIVPHDTSDALPLAAQTIAGLEYLAGHSMQAVMHASAQATGQTLAQHGLPVRVFTAPFDALSLAELMVRTMLETLLVAAMLHVDPFDQPAVEQGKQHARAMLAQGAAS